VSGKAIDLAQVLQHKATVDIPAGDQSIFKDFLKGAHIGSRVAGLMGSRVIGALSGVQGADSIPSLGIGNNDAVLVIIDFLKVGAVDCPSSTTTPTVTDVPAAQLPAVVETAGKPTALKFAGVTDATCNGPVRRAVIKQGTGAAVGLTDTVTVNYFGEVFNGKAPFDESFTKKPYTLVLKQFVPGFANGLAGLKVGSRVVLAIPASAAYGNQSNSGIPASSSLYFVVDIVASK
jgi:peptidylprolyl isomerase